MQGSPLYEYSRTTVGKSQDEGEPKLENLKLANFFWCGDRGTVVGREVPVFTGLEYGGFFGVPHRVSIRKSASYGFQWNRIGNCGGSARPLQMVPEERQTQSGCSSRRPNVGE